MTPAQHRDTVICDRCGATNKTLVGGSTWRWNGEDWEHRCADLDPQVGHSVMRATDEEEVTP